VHIATAAHGVKLREASDGTYRHASPALRRRIAALRCAPLRVSPGTEAAADRRSNAAAGRTPSNNGRDADGARELKRRGWRGGARVQAPESRRTEPSASLGGGGQGRCVSLFHHGRSTTGFCCGPFFHATVPTHFVVFLFAYFLGPTSPVTRVLCFNNSTNMNHCSLEREKKPLDFSAVVKLVSPCCSHSS
jgi:hypothetical protein